MTIESLYPAAALVAFFFAVLGLIACGVTIILLPKLLNAKIDEARANTRLATAQAEAMSQAAYKAKYNT